MKKFRSFYLLPYLGLGTIAVFGWYQNKESLDVVFVSFLLFIGLVLPFIIGYSRQWFDLKWMPKRRKLAYTQPPYSELIAMGFENKGDTYLEGVYEGYSIFIIHDWRITASVSLIFFYEPEALDEKHFNAFLKKLISTKFEMSVLGNLLTKVDCGFKSCKYSAVEDRIKEGIAFLKANNCRPIAPIALKKMYEKRAKI